MQVRELTARPVRTIAVVFDPGDEPIGGLTDVAATEGIAAAGFTAIGAFERATVGWFDLDRQDYHRIPVEEQVEVVSLVGDITRAEDGTSPTVHAHVVLARRDGQAVGGHLLEAAVRPTLEVVITETPAELRRRHDPATGLALIDLAASLDRPAPMSAPDEGDPHGQDRR